MVTNALSSAALERWGRFVDAYLTSFNASSAYLRVYGGSPKSAGPKGAALLKHEWVQREIADRTKDRLSPLDITPERVLMELARIGMNDPRKTVHTEGNHQRPKMISEIDEDTARAISGIEFTPEGAVKIKMIDKVAALGLLAKATGAMPLTNTRVGSNGPHTLAGGATAAGDYESCDEEEIMRLIEAHEAEDESEDVIDMNEPDEF